jgi:predicted tellurium resistance membrane protein TerC
LYFLLAGIMELFQYLKHGLAIILTFVGIKMLISDFYHIPIGWALGFIGVVLLGSILLSVYQNRKTKTATSPSADKIV